MKIFVASDIHGDSKACEDIIAKFNEERADQLLLLGDILYHGPRNDLPGSYKPKEVIRLLNAMKDKIVGLRGNCDAEVDQMVLEFPIMAEYTYIISGDVIIYATHGHHANPYERPALPDNAVFISGHTHVAMDKVIDGMRCMNPGSPSLPKEDSKPSYIIIEDSKLELKSLYE